MLSLCFLNGYYKTKKEFLNGLSISSKTQVFYLKGELVKTLGIKREVKYSTQC